MPDEPAPTPVADTLEALQAAADAEAAGGTPKGDAPVEGDPTPPVEGTVDGTPQGDEVVTPPVEGEPAPAAGDGEVEEDALVLTKQFDELFKSNQASKFKSDYDFLQSADHAIRKIGERDEMALLGKKYADRQAEIDAFLAQPLQPPATPSPVPAPIDPKDNVPEFDPTWKYQITQDENGQLVPAPGAPTDIVDRYNRYMDFKNQRMDEFVQDPEKFIAKHIEGRTRELQEEQVKLTQAELAAERDKMAISAWADRNKNLLYVSGDVANGETQAAAQIAELYDDLGAKGMKSPLDRLELATQIVTAAQPKPPKIKQPHPASIRQPAVAPPPVEEKTAEQMIDEGMDLEDVAKIEFERELKRRGLKP